MSITLTRIPLPENFFAFHDLATEGRVYRLSEEVTDEIGAEGDHILIVTGWNPVIGEFTSFGLSDENGIPVGGQLNPDNEPVSLDDAVLRVRELFNADVDESNVIDDDEPRQSLEQVKSNGDFLGQLGL